MIDTATLPSYGTPVIVRSRDEKPRTGTLTGEVQYLIDGSTHWFKAQVQFTDTTTEWYWGTELTEVTA